MLNLIQIEREQSSEEKPEDSSPKYFTCDRHALEQTTDRLELYNDLIDAIWERVGNDNVSAWMLTQLSDDMHYLKKMIDAHLVASENSD